MENSAKPLISVAMGVCYRRIDPSLLQRSIQSILSQSVGDLEVLICEHGSSPEAKAALRQFAAEDSRIRLIQGRSPGTLSQHLNDCIRQAQGQYFARMDDDDFSHPHRFEAQLAYLAEHPEIAFVGSQVNLCCEGKIVGKRALPKFPTVRDFYMTQPFIHPALMFRRGVLESVGGYAEERTCLLCEDYDLLLRLYQAGIYGANILSVLLDYTIPTTVKGSRTMKHRWNETVTRYRRFRDLRLLPRALPYVVKPLAVGLLPECLLAQIKKNGGKTNAIIEPRENHTPKNQ